MYTIKRFIIAPSQHTDFSIQENIEHKLLILIPELKNQNTDKILL